VSNIAQFNSSCLTEFDLSSLIVLRFQEAHKLTNLVKVAVIYSFFSVPYSYEISHVNSQPAPPCDARRESREHSLKCCHDSNWRPGFAFHTHSPPNPGSSAHSWVPGNFRHVYNFWLVKYKQRICQWRLCNAEDALYV
jgi:hypothetical protein